MKNIIFVIAAITISSSAYSQSIGGLLGRAAGAVGGKAQCTATYAISDAGVFGRDTRTETRNVSGRSIGDACQKAKRENDSDSGVFGNSTKYLSSMTCTLRRGITTNVDVQTCEARI